MIPRSSKAKLDTRFWALKALAPVPTLYETRFQSAELVPYSMKVLSSA